jgi:hypothetical protein
MPLRPSGQSRATFALLRQEVETGMSVRDADVCTRNVDANDTGIRISFRHLYTTHHPGLWGFATSTTWRPEKLSAS